MCDVLKKGLLLFFEKLGGFGVALGSKKERKREKEKERERDRDESVGLSE